MVAICANFLMSLSCLAAAQDEMFSECAHAVGRNYETARDEFLASDIDADFLRKKRASGDWKQRLTAVTLLGWQDHPEYFKRLIETPLDLNRKGVRQYRWSRSPRQLEVTAVPLMYELLLKQTRKGASRDAANALIVLAGKKVKIDNELLVSAISDAEMPVEVKRSAAFLISNLPTQAFTISPLRLLDTAGTSQDREVAASLIEGLVRHRGKIDDKDMLVGKMLSNANLKRRLHSTQLIRAAGEVGGEQGAQVAAQFLEKSSKSSDKRWAINALSRSGTDIGKQAVLAYAIMEQEPASVRQAAIRGLARVSFDKGIGKVLTEIASEPNRLSADRIEAVRALDALQQINRDQPFAAGLRENLQHLKEANFEDAGVNAELKKLLNGNAP